MFTKEQYLFLLEQFLMEPSERTPEYGRRLVNTFVTSMVVSGRELVINFNVSDETVNKNKKTSQTNLQKKVRLGCVWSEWRESNSRPLEPHSSALPKLRYTRIFVVAHRSQLH